MTNVIRIERASAMDEPRLDDGYTRIVNPLVEALAATKLSSMEFRLIMAVVRKTYGYRRGKDRITDSQLAEIMGVSRTKVCTVRNRLMRAKILLRLDGCLKLNTCTEQWELPEKKTRPPRPGAKKVSPNTEHEVSPKTEHHGAEKVFPNTEQKVFPNTEHTKEKKEIYISSTPTGCLSDSAESDPKAKKPKQQKPPCPYNEIVDLYHTILPELPRVRVLSEKRKSQIRARWNSSIGPDAKHECWHLEFWERYFRYVRRCPFLMGQSDPAPGRRVFMADLEWLTKASNFIKVIERKYEGGTHGNYRQSGGQGADALSRQLTDIAYAIDNF